MALVTSKQNQETRQQADKPDGYLNIKVVDADGNEHGFSRGISLYMNRRLDKSILQAAAENPDKEFKVVASVHVVDENQEPINF